MAGQEITTISASLSPDLSTVSGLTAVRETWPRYRDTLPGDRLNLLYGEMQNAALVDNQTLDRHVAIAIAEALDAEMLRTDRGGLTAPEIHEAFSRGRSGMYGDWYRVNLRTVLGWIDSLIREKSDMYREIERRKRAGSTGEFYLEKVRRHAEEMLKNTEP